MFKGKLVTKNLRVLFSLFFLYAFSPDGIAQTPDPFKPELNKSLLAQSPNAAAFAKQALFPVTLYNGVPNVSFPLYEVKNGPLSVGISLSYNYNGFRPKEEASWVGLGWNLNAGGVITRTIRGELDEDPFIPAKKFDAVSNQNLYTNSQDYLTEIGEHFRDGEPDLYIFNFNGISGKFILQNGKAVLFPHQDLKIEKMGSIFTISTDDGTRYLFNDYEMNQPKALAPTDPTTPQHISAWYLTKITAPDNIHEIDFQYTTATYRDRAPRYSETFQRKMPHQALYPTDVVTSAPVSASLIETKILQKIITRNTVVNFNLGDLRQDINYNEFNSHRALGSVSIQSGGATIKTYSFNYDYFVNGTYFKKLRLLSFETKALDELDNLVTEKHQFEYQGQAQAMPADAPNTRGIDHWGFSNGFNSNVSLAPPDIVSGPPTGYPTGTRTANGASQYGLLNKVIYPTGGRTEFYYEQNRYNVGFRYIYTPNSASVFSYYGSTNPTITTINFTVPYQQDVTVYYERNIPGFNPSLGHKEFGKIASIVSVDDMEPVFWDDPSPYMDMELNRTRTVNLRAGDYQLRLYCRPHATYTYGKVDYFQSTGQVYEGDPGPGARLSEMRMIDNVTGKTITKQYKYLKDDKTSSGKLMVLPNYPYKESKYYCGGFGPCQCGQTFKIDITKSYPLDFRSSFNGLSDLDFYYQKVTELTIGDAQEVHKSEYVYELPSLELLTGVDLKNESHYKQTGSNYQLLSSSTYNYSYFSKGLVTGLKTNLAVSGECFPTWRAFPELFEHVDIRNRWKHYAPELYFLNSMWKKVASKVDQVYDPGTGNYLVSNIDYLYESSYHTRATKEKQTNSKGETVTVEHIYPSEAGLHTCVSLPTIESNFGTAKIALTNNYQSCVTTRAAGCSTIVQLFKTGQASYETALACYDSYNCDGNSYAPFATALDQYFTELNSRKNCIQSAFTNAVYPNKAILFMDRGQITGVETETIRTVNQSGTENVTAAVKTNFALINGTVPLPDAVLVGKFSSPVPKSTFLSNKNTYYDQELEFKYNSDANIVSQNKSGDVVQSYVWGHNKNLVIASVTNAVPEQIAFTGFEDGDYGTWTFVSGSLNNIGKTLQTSFQGTLSKTVPIGNYTVTAWVNIASGSIQVGGSAGTLMQTIEGWGQYEWKLSNVSSITVTGTYIDELRLFPTGAQMTTYTHKPLVGLLGQADPNNRFVRYEYDYFNRLKYIYDQEGNILKSFQYKLQEQQ